MADEQGTEVLAFRTAEGGLIAIPVSELERYTVPPEMEGEFEAPEGEVEGFAAVGFNYTGTRTIYKPWTPSGWTGWR